MEHYFLEKSFLNKDDRKSLLGEIGQAIRNDYERIFKK